MIYLYTFYENYVALCTRENKSPSAVSEAIGLSRTSAAGWKKGNVPRDTTIKKIAQYFNVPVSVLTEGTDISVPETKERVTTPMSEGGVYWAERLSRLTASDQALLGTIADRLQDSPEATRAGIGLLLAAVQSVPQGL